MPLYEYQCSGCAHRFERIVKFSDAPMKTCPQCGQETAEQLISAPAVQFKGSGWYVTDYARKASPGSSSSSSSDSNKSEAGSESASASKDSGSSDANSNASSTAGSSEKTASSRAPSGGANSHSTSNAGGGESSGGGKKSRAKNSPAGDRK